MVPMPRPRTRTMMLVSLCLFPLAVVMGCSANEAFLLDEQDVAQAVTLREARDAKICLKLDGMVNLSSVLSGSDGTASVDGLLVTGKNVSFQECQAYFRGTSLVPARRAALSVGDDGVVSVEVPD